MGQWVMGHQSGIDHVGHWSPTHYKIHKFKVSKIVRSTDSRSDYTSCKPANSTPNLDRSRYRLNNKVDIHDIVGLATALIDLPITSDSIINFMHVKAAVSRLKPHKRQLGCSELSFDEIIDVGDDCLSSHIAFFSA